MTRTKELQERYDLGHGHGHCDKRTFEKLKEIFESQNCEVNITKEKGDMIYFKMLSKHPQTKLCQMG